MKQTTLKLAVFSILSLVHEDTLGGLDDQYKKITHNFGLELDSIEIDIEDAIMELISEIEMHHD